MNFCDESDLYVSLYIDDLMDDLQKKQFEKHIEKCTHCAKKLKEQTHLSELCKSDEIASLPVDFAINLHNRLVKVAQEESKQPNNTFVRKLVYNKKLMASLSTAAVVVISLLLYNLFPIYNSDTADIRMDSATAANSSSANQESGKGSSGVSKEQVPSIQANIANDIQTSLDDQTPSIGANSYSQQNAKKEERKADKHPATASLAENTPANSTNEQVVALTGDLKRQVIYYSNYAELNLNISNITVTDTNTTDCAIELDKLKQIMTSLGAIQIKGNNETPNETYIEYVLTLKQYSVLQQELAKYQLDLEVKTDIIKNDITEEYNSLNSEKLEVDQEIIDGQAKAQDTTELKARQAQLQKQLDELTAKQELITVRIYLVQK